MARSNHHTRRSSRSESYLLRLETLEERLPPGTVLALPGVPLAALSWGGVQGEGPQDASRIRLLEGLPRDHSGAHAEFEETRKGLATAAWENATAEFTSETQVSLGLASSWARGSSLATTEVAPWEALVTSWFGNPVELAPEFSKSGSVPSPMKSVEQGNGTGLEPALGSGGGEVSAPLAMQGSEQGGPGVLANQGGTPADLLWLTALVQGPAEPVEIPAFSDGSEEPGTQATSLECTPVVEGQAMTINSNTNRSPGTRVESRRVLAQGVRYTLIVRGTIRTAPNERADAEFVNFANPRTDDQGLDVGLKLTGVQVVGRVWGNRYLPNHVYVLRVVGQGQRLGAWFLDADPGNNQGSFAMTIAAGECSPPDIGPKCNDEEGLCDEQEAVEDMIATAVGACGDGTLSESHAQRQLPPRVLRLEGMGKHLRALYMRIIMGSRFGNNLREPIGFSPAPVRYADGTVQLSETDLASDTFGTPWGHTRSWTNHPGYHAPGQYGDGVIVSQLPYLLKDEFNGNIAVVSNGTTSRWFNYNAGPPVTYIARHYVKDTLTVDGDDFKLVDSTGQVIRFFGYSTSLPWAQRGAFKSLTDPHGGTDHVTEVKTWNTEGKPTLVERTGTMPGPIAITEKYEYTYYGSGSSANGLLQNVTLRRVVGATSTLVRQVDYTYYDGTEPYGEAGNLKTAVIKDGAGASIETK